MTEVYKGIDPDPHTQYVWDLRYVDSPVVRFHDGDTDGTIDDTMYYTTDANFNVTALIEDDGTVAERYAYDPYGQATVLDADWSADADGASDVDNRILYAGYRYDSETALYHVRNRVYHATLGRFVQRDPLGYVDGMSLYQYVGGRPNSNIDPFGLDDWQNDGEAGPIVVVAEYGDYAPVLLDVIVDGEACQTTFVFSMGVVLVTALTVFAQDTQQQSDEWEDWGAEVAGCRLHIEAPQQEYRVGEPIVLRATIRNVSGIVAVVMSYGPPRKIPISRRRSESMPGGASRAG